MELTPDYLNSTGRATYWEPRDGFLEGWGMFKRGSVYYYLTGHGDCVGAMGSDALVFTAPHPLGPWSADAATNINPNIGTNDGAGARFAVPSQMFNVFTITQANGTNAYVYFGLGWPSNATIDKCRQLWIPLSFEANGTVKRMEFMDEFSLDITLKSDDRAARHGVVLEATETALTLSNAHTSATFDLLCPRISSLRGDSSGQAAFGENMLVPGLGVRLEVQPFSSRGCVQHEHGIGAMPSLQCPYAQLPPRSAREHGEGCHTSPLAHRIVTNTSEEVSLVIGGVSDAVGSPAVSSAWTLTLRRGARGLELQVHATAQADAEVTAVRIAHDFAPRSMYAQYDKGALQMMNAPKPYYSAPLGNPLRRFYALGGPIGPRGGAVEVIPMSASSADAVVIARGSWNSGQGGATGLQLVMKGNFSSAADSCAFRPGLGPQSPGSPVGSDREKPAWKAGWENAAAVPIAKGEAWTLSTCLLANDYAFPPSRGDDAETSCGAHNDALASTVDVDAQDEASILSALYGSSMGTMTSFVNYPLGAVVGGLASPIHFAEGSYNNFDPDSWQIINTMVMSTNDSFVLSEAKKLLETTIAGQCTEEVAWGEGACVPGQMPLAMYPPENCHWPGGCCSCVKTKKHETEGGAVFFPSYCPHPLCTTAANVFVPLAAMDFAASTGDYKWLESVLPQLRAAVWMHTRSNLVNSTLPSDFPSVGLIRCPGPLWVDPFLRSNFTAETNLFTVEVFNRFAEVEEHFGNATGAAKARAVASTLANNINSKLWDHASNDHYITQLNPDNSTEDFLDIDSNLMAVAFGVADETRAAAIMKRLATLPCVRPAGYGTMLTGKYMGVAATNGGMIGDSSVAMARVFIVDALSLRRVNDVKTFSRMLSTMQADQERNTWMAERYNCEGLSSHDPFYHEFPETIAMVLQRVKYGINIGLNTVEVLPWVALFQQAPRAVSAKAYAGPLSASFRYRLSGADIAYSRIDHGCATLSVRIHMSRLSGTKRYRVGGFNSSQSVQLRVSAVPGYAGVRRPELIAADGDGVVEFNAPTGPGYHLELCAA